MIARNLILIVGHTEMETCNYPLSIMCGASLHEQTSTAVYNGDWLHTTYTMPGSVRVHTCVQCLRNTVVSGGVCRYETTAERCDEER